jgi:hypothetical protein
MTTQPKKPMAVGDRVRLIGHANISGESIGVEGLKAVILGSSPGARLKVKLLRSPEEGDYECDVYPSQIKSRLVKKPKPEPRQWWVELDDLGEPIWGRDHEMILGRGREIVHVVEVRQKKARAT